MTYYTQSCYSPFDSGLALKLSNLSLFVVSTDDTLGNASHNGLLDTDNKEVVFNTLQPRSKD